GEVTEVSITIGKEEKKQLTLPVKAAPPPVVPSPKAKEAPQEPRSMIPVVVLGTGAVAATATGIGLLVGASGRQSDALRQDNAIINAGKNCVVSPRDSMCVELDSTAHSVDTLRYVSVGAFIGAGVLA